MSSISLRDSADTIRLKRSDSCASLNSNNPQPITAEPSSTCKLEDMDVDELDQELKKLVLVAQDGIRDLKKDPNNSLKKQTVLQVKDKIKEIKVWTSKLSTEEGRRLLNERKTYVEKRKYQIDQVLKMVKAESEVDICFLVDCTSSMKKYIKTVKDDINQLTNTITTLFKTTPYLAFIGYRDVHDRKSNLVQLNFTTDVNIFREFLNSVNMKGGKDYCEDVIDRTNTFF